MSTSIGEQKFDTDYILKGIELMFEGRGVEAVKHFEKVPPEHPEYFNVMINKASALSQLGFDKEAHAQIDSLLVQIERKQLALLVKKVRFYERANDFENAVKASIEFHKKMGMAQEELEKLEPELRKGWGI